MAAQTTPALSQGARRARTRGNLPIPPGWWRVRSHRTCSAVRVHTVPPPASASAREQGKQKQAQGRGVALDMHKLSLLITGLAPVCFSHCAFSLVRCPVLRFSPCCPIALLHPPALFWSPALSPPPLVPGSLPVTSLRSLPQPSPALLSRPSSSSFGFRSSSLFRLRSSALFFFSSWAWGWGQG